MKNEGILIVRAEVNDFDRVAFDKWYDNEHLLEAMTVFGADRAWRGWSEVENGIHYANYAFSNVEAAIATLSSLALKNLVKKF